MKRLFNVLAFVFVFIATAMAANKPAVITGKIKDFDPQKSHLMTMDASNLMGGTTPMACNPDGTFRLELNLEKPTRYYIVVDDPHTGLIFYVQPGMKADMQIAFETVNGPEGESVKCNVDYKGDCKAEYDFIQTNNYYNAQNEVLMKCFGDNAPKGITFKQFRDEMRAAVDKHEALFANVGGKAFRQYMKEDYEAKYPTSLSWYTDLSNGTLDADYEAYIATLPYQTDPQAASTYASYYKKFKTPQGADAVVNLLKNVNNIFTDKKIVAQIAEQETGQVMAQAPENIDDVYNAYVAAVGGTPSDAVKAAYEQNKANTRGKAGVNFAMQDRDGKEIHLADLKGKAVYFDMWATWCGPCCAEIPNMAKLAAHYKDDPRIQIISVSLDEKKDKWLKKIAADKPEWPQYIMPDNFNSELCKAYTIHAIPRFMMFDKDGNVISIDAPRPSDPDIINWIEGNLK